MYSYVLTEKKNLQFEPSDIPKCSEHEILTKMTHCGICRTDRKAYHEGQRDLHMPRVLGHEIVGIIEEIGGKIKGYQCGQRVVIHPGIFCGECEACKSGLDQLCGKMKILGFHLDGGFAEYCLIPKEGVINGVVLPIPENLSSDHAVLAEPLACAINMFESIKPKKKDNLLILGGGALGLLTAKLWRAHGIRDISIIEPNKMKRAVLKNMEFQTYEKIDEVNKNFSVSIPCCPGSEAFINAVDKLKPRGCLGYFSGLTGDDLLPIKFLNNIHYRELRIFGAYGCSLNNTKKALELLAQGICNDIPINHIFPDGIEENLKSLEQENSLITTIIYK